MALAPLLYNITFDSQTRILYFWDKAGHEIYHCEIPSPAPALPTVSSENWVNFTARMEDKYKDLAANEQCDVHVGSLFDTVPYTSNLTYAISRYYYRTVVLGWNGLQAIDNSGVLAVKNITSSTLRMDGGYYVTCDSPDATVITVYDSSNNPYNAFKYTSDGTDYYYVLDGTQTDWTDDLESIGYHVPPAIDELEIIVSLAVPTPQTVSFSSNDYWYSQLLTNDDVQALVNFGGELKSNGSGGYLINASPLFFYEVADVYTGNGTGSIPVADLSNFRCAIGTQGYIGALNIRSTNAYNNVMTWKVRITKVPNVAWVKANRSSDWTGSAGSLPLYDASGNTVPFDSTKTYTVLGYYTSENSVDLSRMNTEHNYGLSIINDSGNCKIKWADSTSTILIQRVIYKVE